MKVTELTNEELEKYYINNEIIQETADQIIKDFSSFSFIINFSGDFDNAYNELSKQLVSILNELLNDNYSQLMNVLYRIDVSEKELTKTIKDYPELSQAEIISELIIKRELRKVITRKAYKKFST